jgi:phage shock protein C
MYSPDSYSPLRKRLYRGRNGRIFGVCEGFANYFDLNVSALRLLAILLIWFTGIFPGLLIYLVLAMVLKPAPDSMPASDEEADFWNLCHSHPDLAMDRIRRRRADLDRRLQRLESIVTSPRFDLEREFRNL